MHTDRHLKEHAYPPNSDADKHEGVIEYQIEGARVKLMQVILSWEYNH